MWITDGWGVNDPLSTARKYRNILKTKTNLEIGVSCTCRSFTRDLKNFFGIFNAYRSRINIHIMINEQLRKLRIRLFQVTKGSEKYYQILQKIRILQEKIISSP